MRGPGRGWICGHGAGWGRRWAGAAILLCAAVLGTAGCRYELDGLYALPLDRPPEDADWLRLPPYRVEVVGGRTSAPSEADVDDDAVHVTTASCHHGAEAPPVVVELRSFWTDERLYLRADWTDPTENRGPVWEWTGSSWLAAGQWEDGLGILWGREGEPFHCARYCHLEDWRMAGDRARADYAMQTPAGEGGLDFWVWRAGRGSVEGTVEDSALGPKGRFGDGESRGETYAPNSVRHGSGAADWFGTNDAPQVHPAPGPGARAPGYLSAEVPAGRREVDARTRWDRGRWTVVLSRRLAPGEAGDVPFAPGSDHLFGLAILDAVDQDHLAAADPVRLHLVPVGDVDDRGTGGGKNWWVSESPVGEER